MRKTLGMNRHQKAVYKTGERRVGREQIEEMLEQSTSKEPAERLEAAKWLCPCHVRRRLDEVWEALYRLLEDDDVRVRRQAWHTLEDGGRPDDPKLDAILERVQRSDPDPTIQNYIRQIGGPRRERELAMARVAGRPRPKQRGRCDFCGEPDVPVEQDLRTMIPAGDFDRPALVCERCR
jgi:hypothetical protein